MVRFEGVYTALVSPFSRDKGTIDHEMLKLLIKRQADAGTQGIVIAGSTGEGQTLTNIEWKSSIQTAVNSKSSLQVLASCGSSSTKEACDKAREACDLGVDGILVASPSYNKPPQRGLIKHFDAIASTSSVPLMIYNIPGRTAVNILPETLLELWKIPNIVSIKESSGNLDQAMQILQNIPAGKTFLSGDDGLSLALWSCGASGVVSVASNITPKGVQSFWQAWKSDSVARAQSIHRELMPLISALFVESNPIPVKWMMSQILNSDLFSLRLPLVELDSAFHSKLRQEIENLRSKGLLE